MKYESKLLNSFSDADFKICSSINQLDNLMAAAQVLGLNKISEDLYYIIEELSSVMKPIKDAWNDEISENLRDSQEQSTLLLKTLINKTVDK